MPCDTIQLNRVDIEKLDAALVRAVLASGELEAAGFTIGAKYGSNVSVYYAGMRYDLDYQRGTIDSRASVEEIAKFRNALMRGYSRQAIHVAAKRNGWKVRQVGVNKYEAQS